jgi:FkbM family methyltransferase
MIGNRSMRWLRRVIPAKLRHLLREIVYGPRVDEVELVHRLLREGAGGRVMIDVGAHKGAALEAFARDDWHVLAFEPDPDNRDELEEFCRGQENVEIDNRAVSNREADELPWFRSDISSGISSLEAFHESHESAGCVEVTTLARALEQHKIEQVDFLKIDAEGTDLFVLQGFPWDWLKPNVVVCEFENDKTEALGYQFADLANFLVDQGYEILVSEWHPITRYGGSHRWRRFAPYPCELVSTHAWGNLIAVRDADEFSRLRSIAQN